jgi:hypothetical protein
VLIGDRFAYNPTGNGRWMSLNLKKRKKMGGKKRVKKVEPVVRDDEDEDVDMADVREMDRWSDADGA